MGKTDFDVLPDGTKFSFWDCQTTFTKSYYVMQQNPQASDDGPGTAEKPFRTIGRAAAEVMPGEKVVIGAGVYRECVHPARGGTSAEKMISYEAAPGDKPVITGAEIWLGPWVESEGWRLWGPESRVPGNEKTPGGAGVSAKKAKIWMGRFPGKIFEGYNPFSMSNIGNTPWSEHHFYEGYQGYSAKHEYLMRRGIVLVDGVPLTQASFPNRSELQPGTFWIEDSGLVVHFRLADDGDPKDHVLEFTAREQCFTPLERYFGYIRVKGLTLEKVGNGLPAPQRGALSANCGNHWIVEDNVVRWANTLGIDVGSQSPKHFSTVQQGRHIVRRNLVTDCGVCGIAGIGAERFRGTDPDDLSQYQSRASGILVEQNRLERIGWRNVEGLCESAAIKLHSLHNSLLRNNVILDSKHGSGIWADWEIVNTRICGNVIVGIQSTMFGGIFGEASKHPNLVDNNVIWDVGTCPSVGGDPTCGGNGVYQHDSDHQIVRHNVIHGATKTGVMIHLGEIGRMTYGRGSTGRKNRVEHNLLDQCNLAIVMPTPDNFADGNRFGHFVQEGALRIERPEERLSLAAWREFHGWDLNGKNVKVDASLDRARLILSLKTDDGKSVLEKRIDLTQEFSLEDAF